MKKIILSIFLLLAGITNGQTVSQYLFSQSTEAYQAVVGTNSSAVGDDGIQDGIPIGFSFNFGGLPYTTFSISTNGWIRLGNGIGAQSWVNTLGNSNAQSPLIAAFWDDHNRATGAIQYAVRGISPSRTLEIGWDSINIGNNGVVSTSAFGSFKLILHETSGQIDFVYAPTMNIVIPLTASIGLNDTSSFISVTPNTPLATTSTLVSNDNITNTQNVVGQKFVFTPPSPCSGVPNPGNTISNTLSVCSGVEFNLSLENQLPNYGLNYQWQSSTDGITFTAIVNANNSTLSTTQTSNTYYQCEVSCGNAISTSNSVLVGVNNPSNCYCIPNYSVGKTFGDLISNVVITGTTLSNATGTSPVNPSYTYFTGLPTMTAALQSGFTYEMNITVGTYQDQNVAVWIDYNDDALFSPSERIGYTANAIGSNGTGVFAIALACDAAPGVHRMRIRDVYQIDAATIDPCSTYQYGETEDYDVLIETPVGCQAPYGLGTTTVNPTSAQIVWSTGCSQIFWDVHLALAGGGLPADVPSNPNVTSPLVLTGLATNTTYEFYVRASCGENGFSDWAGPYSFTTLPTSVTNDDCESATPLIPGGSFEEHAVVATNLGATKTIGQPNPTCAIFGFGGDVWFSTVVPDDGAITIEVRADQGSPFIDSGLSVFTGDCGSLTTIGCSDDEGIDAFSRLNFTGLTPGQTLYARVWEYANDTFGTFQVSAWNTVLKTESFQNDSLTYYPNPVTYVLHIANKTKLSNIVIYNMLGQEVLCQKLQDSKGTVNTSMLPIGNYIVKVTNDDEVKTFKISKK